MLRFCFSSSKKSCAIPKTFPTKNRLIENNIHIEQFKNHLGEMPFHLKSFPMVISITSTPYCIIPQKKKRLNPKASNNRKQQEQNPNRYKVDNF